MVSHLASRKARIPASLTGVEKRVSRPDSRKTRSAKRKKWIRADSNRGPQDCNSCALPTGLCGLLQMMVHYLVGHTKMAENRRKAPVPRGSL